MNCGKGENFIGKEGSQTGSPETSEDLPDSKEEGLRNALEYLKTHNHPFFDNNSAYFTHIVGGQFPEDF